jgi:PAS domain S-box-containing protein
MHELEVRQRLIESILQTLDLDKRLSTALFEIMKLIEAEMGCIYLVERDRLILRIHQGLPDDLLASLRDLPLAKTTWSRETAVHHERLSEQGGQMEEIFKAAGLQSWVAFPLKVEDRLIGTLFLSSRRYEAFSADGMRALSALAELVAVGVENARLYTETQQRLVRLTTLREIDRAIAAQLSLKDIMGVILKQVPFHIVGVDAVGFSLIDWEKKNTHVAILHLQDGVCIEDEAFRLSESLMGDMVKHRRPVLVYDLQIDPRIQNFREIIRQYGLKSYLGVPLVVQDQVIGLLHVLTTQPKYFRDEEVDFFVTMAGQAAIALRNAQFFGEIKTSEERYRSLFDRMPLGLYRTTPEGKIIDVNPALVQILGYPDQESLLGINVAETYVDPKDRVQWRSLVNREGIVRNYEMQLRRRDGTIIWVEENARVIRNPEGQVLCYEGGLQDITERKRTEEKIHTYQEQLRSLSLELTIVEERERRRIAMDLHDHIGQTLATIKMKLGGVREMVSPSSHMGPVDEIQNLIEQAIHYTRSLTFEVSPPVLYELSFDAAMEWLTEQIQDQHHIQVDLEDDRQPRPMSDEIRISLFKAVRELLINIAKHAKAHKAKVSTRREGNTIRITVEDDGVGFSLPEDKILGKIGGYGLFSIRERLRHLGGSFEIESKLGCGTRVTLVAPLEQENNKGGMT